MKLIRDEEHLGIVGEKTNYRTNHGEDVHVGDIVKVAILGDIMVSEVMVKGKNCFGVEKAFVMGVEIACNDKEGTVEGEKILEIVKPYTALEVGDELGTCNVVVVGDTKEEKKEVPATEDLGEKIFFGIIEKAISDLKDAGKDYHGLAFIKMVLKEGIK